ncbi:MAG: 3'-5' exonuclease domain-containing protein 2 [Bacteroidales bacterium]|nr:3'-5' exonuclease domain-containing protein 2 [Bacteroidales bacterium]
MTENKYLSDITTDELNNYKQGSFQGKILTVESSENFHYYLEILKKQKYLGFDTETKPSFKKGKRNRVSLLQLAFDNTAILFRINKIGLPSGLLEILSDPDIIKAGVAVNNDLRILRNVTEFTPAGFVDLQNMAKEYGIESTSLKKLTAIILGFRISKRQQVTNWNADVLSDAQKIYAATDAWVCYEIYQKLKEKE